MVRSLPYPDDDTGSESPSYLTTESDDYNMTYAMNTSEYSTMFASALPPTARPHTQELLDLLMFSSPPTSNCVTNDTIDSSN